MNLQRTLRGERPLEAVPSRAETGDRQGATMPALTSRERQVLLLLAEGCSNRDIARQLSVNESTVKGHVGRLMHKLEARSRLHVVARAAALGFDPC